MLARLIDLLVYLCLILLLLKCGSEVVAAINTPPLIFNGSQYMLNIGATGEHLVNAVVAAGVFIVIGVFNLAVRDMPIIGMKYVFPTEDEKQFNEDQELLDIYYRTESLRNKWGDKPKRKNDEIEDTEPLFLGVDDDGELIQS